MKNVNESINLGSGDPWAAPMGVNPRFENLLRNMGNIALAEFVELNQAVEFAQDERSSEKCRAVYAALGNIPVTVVHQVLTHPVWLYWVRSTRQILKAVDKGSEVEFKWRGHLHSRNGSASGLFSESLDSLNYILLAGLVLARQEADVLLKVWRNEHFCVPATGLSISPSDVSFAFSDTPRANRGETLLAQLRKDNGGGFLMSLSRPGDAVRFVVQLREADASASAWSEETPDHYLPQMTMAGSRCDIDNRNRHMIKNWVSFDVFPGKPVVVPVPDKDLASWRINLDSAYRMLERCYPLVADEISRTLRSVIPVKVDTPEQSVSCSSRDFWGATQVSSHPGIALPEVLVHEHRHNVLNALFELDPIVSESASGQHATYYSPWRSDPRPVTGLLHGIYSFLEVVAFNFAYLQKYGATGSESDFAEKRIIANVCRLKLAAVEFERSVELTQFGAELYNALRKRLDAFDEDSSEMNPSFLRRQIRETEAHRAAWMDRYA